MRKKVRYSITRYDHNKSSHFSGYGEIDEENLYTEYQNKYGETVEHVYEDCIKKTTILYCGKKFHKSYFTYCFLRSSERTN